MAPLPERPSTDAPLYRFAFTKLQIGMLAAGLAVLMGLSFSLGFVVAGREAERRAGAGGRLAADADPGRRSSVKLELPAGQEAGRKAETPIEAQFYKALTAPKAPGGESQALEPIRLPDGPALQGKRQPPPRETGVDGREPPARKPASDAAQKEGEPPPPGGREAPAEGWARFTIQVLSVREPERAERALRALLGKGVPAFIEQADLKERGVWHRVRVGRFADRAAAERALEELRRKGALRDASIVPP